MADDLFVVVAGHRLWTNVCDERRAVHQVVCLVLIRKKICDGCQSLWHRNRVSS